MKHYFLAHLIEARDELQLSLFIRLRLSMCAFVRPHFRNDFFFSESSEALELVWQKCCLGREERKQVYEQYANRQFLLVATASVKSHGHKMRNTWVHSNELFSKIVLPIVTILHKGHPLDKILLVCENIWPTWPYMVKTFGLIYIIYISFKFRR